MSSHNKSEFLRLCMTSGVIGFVVAFLFNVVLVGFNVLGSAELLTTFGGAAALFVVWMLNGLAFSVLQFVIAVSGRDDDDDDHDGGHFAREYLAEPVLIPIEKDQRRRR